MEDFIEVITTTGSRTDAQTIADMAVEKRFAACAQIIGPIWSTYWWENQIEHDEEWLCSLKTRKEHYFRLEEEIKAIHPYELPQVICISLLGGAHSYLEWVHSQLRKWKMSK